MNTGRPASINAIAERAGVSRNTVSLAMRGDARVAPDTRDRVLAVAADMGYRPNLLARAVVTGRSRTLGLALTRVNYSYVPRLVEAVHEVAFEAGYGILTCFHHGDPARLGEATSFLLDRRVEGVIVNMPPSPSGGDPWAEVRRSGVPCASFGYGDEARPGLRLDLLPAPAGAMAARRLAEAGHRRVAYAGGLRGFFEESRLGGVREALESLGLPAPEAFAGEQSIDGGRAAGRAFLASGRGPTGVVCFTDEVAVGFVQELAAAGVKVPGDVSVIGVDGLDVALGSTPPITTLRAPAEEMGRAAAQALIHGQADPSGSRVFDWEWVERESVASPPTSRSRKWRT